MGREEKAWGRDGKRGGRRERYAAIFQEVFEGGEKGEEYAYLLASWVFLLETTAFSVIVFEEMSAGDGERDEGCSSGALWSMRSIVHQVRQIHRCYGWLGWGLLSGSLFRPWLFGRLRPYRIFIGLTTGSATFAPEERLPLHRKKDYLCTGKTTFAPEERLPLHRSLCNILICKGYIGFVGIFDFAALYRFLERHSNDDGALPGLHAVHDMLYSLAARYGDYWR